MTHEELIAIRETNNLTKSAFAKLIGITAMMQGRYESGKVTIPEKVEEAVKKVFAPAEEKAAAEEQPKKKSTRGRKKKEAVEPAAPEAAPAVKEEKAKKTKAASSKKAKVTAPSVSIESLLGGKISVEEITARVLEAAPDATEIFVKAEENKAYYTAESGNGFVVLWE